RRARARGGGVPSGIAPAGCEGAAASPVDHPGRVRRALVDRGGGVAPGDQGAPGGRTRGPGGGACAGRGAPGAQRHPHGRGALAPDPTTVLALLREVEPPGIPRGWAELSRWALGAGVARGVFLHPDVVSSAAWNPDGKRIVTASYDKTVRVWNADGTGVPLVL